MLRAAVFALLLALLPAHVRAEAKFALLIGNKAYDPSAGALTNSHHDIAVVGEALSKQGFEVLPLLRDARRSAMLGGARELVRRLNAAGAGAIGFIYYSGHRAAEKDTNIIHLIPVDAKDLGSTTFWHECLKLDANPFFDRLAAARLEELRPERLAATTPASVSPPSQGVTGAAPAGAVAQARWPTVARWAAAAKTNSVARRTGCPNKARGGDRR
jgi:hypothetical protein